MLNLQNARAGVAGVVAATGIQAHHAAAHGLRPAEGSGACVRRPVPEHVDRIQGWARGGSLDGGSEPGAHRGIVAPELVMHLSESITIGDRPRLGERVGIDRVIGIDRVRLSWHSVK